MSDVTLTARRRGSLTDSPGLPDLPIDASALRPDQLCNQSGDAINNTTVRVGRRQVPIGELFTTRLTTAKQANQEPRLTIKPATLRLDNLGNAMSNGQLRIRGNAGAGLGLNMRGGQITVEGNAGPFAASAMRGGVIHIKGNAGERAGGVLPGRQFGMQGGILIIDGNCGTRAGDRMRRGIMLVGGDSADQCAHRMLAGTIVVNGQCGADNGFELRHGSLVLLNSVPTSVLNTFANTGRHELRFLKLLAKAVQAFNKPIAAQLSARINGTRLAGDLAVQGRGEILLLAQ